MLIAQVHRCWLGWNCVRPGGKIKIDADIEISIKHFDSKSTSAKTLGPGQTKSSKCMYNVHAENFWLGHVTFMERCKTYEV